MPKYSGWYIVWKKSHDPTYLNNAHTSFYDDDEIEFSIESQYTVTHWMPLPEPPQS